MKYLAGLIWCIIFSTLGIYLASLRKRYRHYITFTARVKQIRQSLGKHIAVMDASITEITEFEIQFQDFGDYNEGEEINCMWDGKDPKSAQPDLRSAQKIGSYLSIGAVLLMLIGLTLTS